MKKIAIVLFLALTLCLLAVSLAFAQDESITLKLSRDFGYSSGTGDIQGLFSMKVTGPDNLVRVEFYIDETMVGEDAESPFRIQFSTDDYPLGLHDLYAIGYTSDGQELRSRLLTGNFVSADEGWGAASKIILPMAVILLVAITLAVIVPAIVTRGKLEHLPLGEERTYGIRGGAICPKCHRPFAMHLWGLNLGLSRYDRCPYCGKWSVVRVQSLAILREAEKAELTWAEVEAPPASEEDKLRKELDDSKYQGM
ncbi:MAG: Ig-like domain-containing protein [Chloroflexota bacterium]